MHEIDLYDHSQKQGPEQRRNPSTTVATLPMTSEMLNRYNANDSRLLKQFGPELQKPGEHNSFLELTARTVALEQARHEDPEKNAIALQMQMADRAENFTAKLNSLDQNNLDSIRRQAISAKESIAITPISTTERVAMLTYIETFEQQSRRPDLINNDNRPLWKKVVAKLSYGFSKSPAEKASN